MRRTLLLPICLATRLAAADDVPTVTVAVGETVERTAGYAIGFQCDDVTILRAEMVAKSPATNAFVVTGVREGTTRCRIGTDTTRPSELIIVRVVPTRRSPGR